MKEPVEAVNRSQTDNWKALAERSRACLPDDVVTFIEECRKEERPQSRLISVLHRLQKHRGYLGREEMDAVAYLLQVPSAKVTGVATFYHFFRLQAKGRYVISVCMGTACYVKGAEHVVQRFKDELGVDFGQTTRDGLFTLESTRCVGTCGLAPVVMVNEDVHGKLTPDEVPGLLKKYADQARNEESSR